MATIDDVRDFWNLNPLWTGDDQEQAEPGTAAFFQSHTEACLSEMGGRMDPRFLPVCAPDDPILDLGCGIGFWLEQFGLRGFTNLTGADISTRSLALAGQRCALHGINAHLEETDAEAAHFPDESFAHIQSMGVIHHSPNPRASLRQIHRMLRPGARAVVSVYYKNLPLRQWRLLRPLAVAASNALNFSMKGRGRDNMIADAVSADDLVRLYDGRDNPVGLAFTRAEYLAMLEDFRVIELFTHCFPFRVMPKVTPRALYRPLEFMFPFMICAVLEKQR